MSSLRDLCCLPSVKQKHDFHFFLSMYIPGNNKKLLDSVFETSRIIEVNLYLDLDYSDITKNLNPILFIINNNCNGIIE